MSKVEPKWWGENKDAAIAYAKKHKLYVVKSKGPAGQQIGKEVLWGYWTDDSGFTRAWEESVYSPPDDD